MKKQDTLQNITHKTNNSGLSSRYPELMDDFCLTKGGSHSISGSGGKTTLLWYLASLLKKAGESVTVTTTAKIMIPENSEEMRFYDVFSDSPEIFKQLTSEKKDTQNKKDIPVILLGKPLEDNPEKIASLPKDELKELKRSDRYLLLEADGSKNKPLKWWYGHEPPIPENSDVIYGVIPINMLGETLTEENTYNLAGVKGIASSETCDYTLLKEIVLREDGLFKNSYGYNPKRIVIINRCDTDRLTEHGEKLRELIIRDSRSKAIHSIILTSLKELQNENYSHYSCRRLLHKDETE